MKTLGKNSFYLILIISIGALSHFSNFKLGAVKSFNWDIALMLTPYGILKNTLVQENYLTPYYDVAQQAQPIDHPSWLYALLIVNTVAGLYVLNRFLRSK